MSTFLCCLYFSPEDAPVPAFYLRPKVKWSPGDEIWFLKSPIGHNMLAKRFKEMCASAGLVGNFTNHSLRATAVSSMYDSGVSEKLIMKRSGHRSVEGVRSYQRENPTDKIKVSNVLASSSTTVASSESPSRDTEKNKESEDDLILVNACFASENSLSQINMGGILQGANVGNVHIHINVNKEK